MFGSVEPSPVVIPSTKAAAIFIEHPAFVLTPSVGCFLGVPLVLSDGTLYGTLCVVDPKPKRITTVHVELLQVLARSLATYIERDRALAVNVELMQNMAVVLDRERAARAQHEAMAARVQLLADIRACILQSLDYPTTLAKIVTRLAPDMADCSLIYIPEFDGQPPTVNIAAADACTEQTIDTLLRRFRPEQPAHNLLSGVLCNGQTVYLPTIDPSSIVNIATDAEHCALLSALSLHALLVVPLSIHDTVLGFLLLANGKSNRAFTTHDLQLAKEIAAPIAQGIAHARLYRAEQQAVREKTSALALLDTLVATAPIGVSFLDSDLHYRLINDHLASINGVPVEAHIGRAISEIIPQIADGIEPLLRHVLATGDPVVDLQISGEAANNPGEERFWRVSYYPVPDGDGGIQGVGTVVLDVTDRIQAEREREQLLLQEQEARIAAETAVQARETFLSVAAHELKTPLTTLLGHTFLLQRTREAVGLTPIQLRSVQAIDQQAHRLNTLIDTVLDVTRSQHGRLQIDVQPLNITALIRRIVDEWRPMLERHTLDVCIPRDSIMVCGDEIRLTQVFNNLLNNAVKYSPYGGPIQLSLVDVDDVVSIGVRDQGIGIPQEAQSRLFQPFFRAGNVDPKRISGFGLGLHMVHDIVVLHGGTVSVQSTEAQGSLFTVRLPQIGRSDSKQERIWNNSEWETC